MKGETDEVSEAPTCWCGVKVHHLMCKELTKYIDKIAKIFPCIESAQPRCMLGINALCSLNLTMEKAKLLIQHCTESSKLYLAITGGAIKMRCERLQSAFAQSLTQIQSMVPLALATQISPIVDDLKRATFIMESSEEEAGKVILQLLRQASNFEEDSEFEAFQIAVLRLKLTSPKALLIEKRSIRKLLDKVPDTDQGKERILKYLLYLLSKHGKSVGGSQILSSRVKDEDPNVHTMTLTDNSACNRSIEPERNLESAVYEVLTGDTGGLTPPDEFRCPISRRLIHDPVVIASGQTYERVWIEKWFKEGHDTCPKTQKKLSHLSIVPNSSMKDLITKWCSKHGISVLDPFSQPIPAAVYQWSTSSSTSIASFSSSLNNVPMRPDDSSVSFGSPDVSMVSNTSRDCLASHQTDNSCDSYQTSFKSIHGIDSSSFSELGKLPWESQCILMEDARNRLANNEQESQSIISTSFLETLVRFFKDACDHSDVKAQQIGAAVLLIIVTKNRDELPSFYEDVFYLLISFLDSEIAEEALEIFEVISGDQCCELEMVASGALPSILKIIESNHTKLRTPALRILCNFSLKTNIGTQIIRSGFIPKLISLLLDKSLAPHCITLLNNLSVTSEGRLAIGEANGFISSIIELLESGSHEEQEHAVGILLSLCSHEVEYCKIVSEEGVIPSLVIISINGNTKGKEIARELLHLLRDTQWSDSQSSVSPATENQEFSSESISYRTERKPITKAPGYFKRKLGFFSKPRSVVLY